MLDADRETLELASSGLLGSTDPQSLRQQVSDSDHRVNLLVQQVHRELVVRAAVRSRSDIGFVLANLFTAVHALTDELGAEINALLAADPVPADGAARVLAYQSLALTSLIMPLDKLDFHDES